MARIERVIDEGVAFYERQIARDDVRLFRGEARFVDEHTLECSGETVEFGQALIASGARPHIPDIPGLHRAPFATSDDLLRARELPGHLVCLGAGAVSLEFAQVYRRLGAEVTIVQRGPQLASVDEPELTQLLRRYLEEEGVRVLTDARIERVELDGGRPCVVLASGGERVTGDRLLLGVGRAPVVDGLGLEQVGIESRPTGIQVDEQLRTTLPHVYAIGDAIGGWIFTSPELAGVGLTEEQALAGGYEVQVRRYDVGKSGKARALGDRRGPVKFVLDHRSGEILGAHILARHGADLLPGPMVAMNTPARTLEPLLATIHAHPTLSEAVKVAARDG